MLEAGARPKEASLRDSESGGILVSQVPPTTFG
jgi:hypothetical protein